MVPLKINEVEALVGITKKNIRFYEEKGLLSPSRNSDNGYRDYGEEEVAVLRRIKLMRKLGVPIDEIRRMQEGAQTVGDGMRRHLITLERERQNLEESVRLCELLKERTEPLNDLDAAAVLTELEKLEQTGTTFPNKQKQDVRIRYVAPIVVAVLVVLYIGPLVLMMAALAGFLGAQEGLAVAPFFLLYAFAGGAVIVGVLAAMARRLREIAGGEEEDAKKY